MVCMIILTLRVYQDVNNKYNNIYIKMISKNSIYKVHWKSLGNLWDQKWEVNWEPLSEIIDKGIPCKFTISLVYNLA